jgi:hypothetical protein
MGSPKQRAAIIKLSSPLLASQALARRLFLPIRAHVDVAASRTAPGTYDLAGKRWHLGIVWRCRSDPDVGTRRLFSMAELAE